jgi:hypothetical protein
VLTRGWQLSEINLQQHSPTVSDYEEDLTLTVVNGNSSIPNTEMDDVFGTPPKPPQRSLSPEVDDPLPTFNATSRNLVPQSEF